MRDPLRRTAGAFPDLLHSVLAIAEVSERIREFDGDRDAGPVDVLGRVPTVYRIVHALLAHAAADNIRSGPPPTEESDGGQGKYPIPTRVLLRDNTR